jgi:hypothetical protein
LQIIPESAAPHSLSPSVLSHPQMASVVKHCGLLPVQSEELVVEHSAQDPASVPAVWHAGLVASVQSASAAQGWHVCVLSWQTGVVPEQLVLSRHATQIMGDCPRSQYGVGVEQFAFELHRSITIGVAGAPGPLPLPSDG